MPDEAAHTLWRSVRFPNSRGQQLAGLWLDPCQDGGWVLVVCHGFTGSKEGGGRALRMGEHFALAGLSTLVFDFAGNGESQGRFEDTTLSGQLDDLDAAVGWCLEVKPGARLVGLGRSFGGTTLLCQAARDSRLAAVCTWAAPADPAALFRGFRSQDSPSYGLNRLSDGSGSVCVRDAFFTDLDRHDIPAAAARIAPRPLLILHGSEDEVVPPAAARTLFAAAREPKELQILDGADHRFSQSARQAWSICLDWLKRVQGGTALDG